MSTTFYFENAKHCMFWVWSVPIMLILRSAAEVGFDTAESTPSRIWVTIDSPTNFPPPQPATPDPRPLGSKRVYVQLCFKINQHWPKWSPSLTKSSHATGQMGFQHINAKTIFYLCMSSRRTCRALDIFCNSNSTWRQATRIGTWDLTAGWLVNGLHESLVDWRRAGSEPRFAVLDQFSDLIRVALVSN